MAANDLVVAMTGASGAPYGVRLLETLIHAGRTVHLLLSPAAVQVIQQEMDRRIDLEHFHLSDLLGDAPTSSPLLPGEGPGVRAPGQVIYQDYRNFMAGIASGSFLTGGMVICPCSSGTAAAIAHGLSQNLIHRAADVHLKEKRKLVIVPREAPLSVVQLRNLTICAEVGAVVLPASPGFYTKPQSLDDAINFIVGRICDQLGVEHNLFRRWGEETT